MCMLELTVYDHLGGCIHKLRAIQLVIYIFEEEDNTVLLVECEVLNL